MATETSKARIEIGTGRHLARDVETELGMDPESHFSLDQTQTLDGGLLWLDRQR